MRDVRDPMAAPWIIRRAVPIGLALGASFAFITLVAGARANPGTTRAAVCRSIVLPSFAFAVLLTRTSEQTVDDKAVVAVHVLVYGALGGAMGYSIRRRWCSRDRRGRCAKCDYDLTGNVSRVCPECGTPLPEESVSSKSRTGET